MVHFSLSLDTCGAIIQDGSKAVILSFTDKEEKETHHFPIPLDIAKDLGDEIKRIAKKMEES